jgi:hypothetical protein
MYRRAVMAAREPTKVSRQVFTAAGEDTAVLPAFAPIDPAFSSAHLPGRRRGYVGSPWTLARTLIGVGQRLASPTPLRLAATAWTVAW